jgi:hypothetical protein
MNPMSRWLCGANSADSTDWRFDYLRRPSIVQAPTMATAGLIPDYPNSR